MNIPATPHCEAPGFDSSAIREILSVLELDAQHGVLSNNIRTLIIDERADESVESCSIRLEHDEGLTRISHTFDHHEVADGVIRSDGLL